MAALLFLLLLLFLALLLLLHGLLERLFFASAGLVVAHGRDARRARAGGHGCLTGNVWLWRRGSSLRAAQLHARGRGFRAGTAQGSFAQRRQARERRSRGESLLCNRAYAHGFSAQARARRDKLGSVGKTLARRILLEAVGIQCGAKALLKAAKDQPCTPCRGTATRQNTAPQGLPQPWATPPPYRSASTRTRPAP